MEYFVLFFPSLFFSRVFPVAGGNANFPDNGAHRPAETAAGVIVPGRAVVVGIPGEQRQRGGH